MKRCGTFLLLAIIAGCVAGNRAGLQVNPKGQESGRDSVAGVANTGTNGRVGTAEIATSPAHQTQTSQPATATSHSGTAIAETSQPIGQHTNTGAVVLQYAPVVAGSVGGVFMWLLFRHLSDKLTRKCEIEMKRLDVEETKYILSFGASMSGHVVTEPKPTATNTEPVK